MCVWCLENLALTRSRLVHLCARASSTSAVHTVAVARCASAGLPRACPALNPGEIFAWSAVLSLVQYECRDSRSRAGTTVSAILEQRKPRSEKVMRSTCKPEVLPWNLFEKS